MTQGNTIGYDLNNKGCQISYYNEQQQEPETLEVAVDNYQIPLACANRKDSWMIGKEAIRAASMKQAELAEDLFDKAMSGERITLGEKSYEPVWLLAKFIEISLKPFEQIDYITFTVPAVSVDIVNMLKGIAQRLRIPKDHVYVQDYRESFCYYMFYQPKELWQYEAALFYCDREEIRAYMLRRLKVNHAKVKETFVTVEEVANAQMEELAWVYPVLNTNKAKDADARFKIFIESVFDKKLISSVFLTGEGFENNWYPASLKVLCNGRRAFMGNNLYSKGACYTSYRKLYSQGGSPVYMDDTKIAEQISIKMRAEGSEVWYPIVPWGSHWYEGDRKWEVLLEDTQPIDIHIESLATGETKVESLPLEGLSQRERYTMRLQIETRFLDEYTCKIILKDVGFGEFFPASDFETEITIPLGGSNGQLNSMS